MKATKVIALAFAIAANGLCVASVFGENCTNSAATNAGTTSTTGGGTQTCGDGTSCGHTNTYNPPPPESNPCVVMPNWCCKDQMQSTYTETFSCKIDPKDPQGPPPPPTKCISGGKKFIGAKVAVKISVPCSGNPLVCDAVPNFFGED